MMVVKKNRSITITLPNLIVNGSDGIAVGMATYMVPHNLSETIDAINLVAKNPDVTPREIFENGMLGPDFPTGASILGRKGILDYFETGEAVSLFALRRTLKQR